MNTRRNQKGKRWLLAVCMAAMTMQPDTALGFWGKPKNRDVARQLTDLGATNTAMQALWSDPRFVARFLGDYGFQGDIEPKLRRVEEVQFQKETLLPLLQSDPDKARAALEKYIQPDSSALFDFLLAKMYFQEDQLTNAMRHYEAALAKFPNYRGAHQELGFVLVREQRYDEAAGHLSRTIELGGAGTYTYGLLGFCYLNQEHYVSAEAAYKNAMLLDPDNKDWKLGIVQCLIAMEQFQPALKLLDELLDRHPDQAQFWALQAGVYLQMDSAAQAVVNLEMLRRMGKADLKSLMLLGDIYMMQDATELALEVYLEGLAKEPEGDRSRSLRAGNILAERGAWQEAGTLVARLREEGQTGWDDEDRLKLHKLEVKIALGTGASDRAITLLEKIIASNPLDGEALLMSGDYYSELGEREKAENRFRLASSIAGFEADAWVKHAQSLVKAQKYSEAAELLRKAQSLRPKDSIQRYLEKVEQAARRSGRS